MPCPALSCQAFPSSAIHDNPPPRSPPPPPLLHKYKYPPSAAGAGVDANHSSSDSPLECSSLEFSSLEEHQGHMEGQAKLPLGFRVGTAGMRLIPREVPKEVTMNITAIVLDEASKTLEAGNRINETVIWKP